jgi:hypothetical protein
MGNKTAVPGYEVEFIPMERRLRARRDAAKHILPPPITGERRRSLGRRKDDPRADKHAGLLTPS